MGPLTGVATVNPLRLLEAEVLDFVATLPVPAVLIDLDDEGRVLEASAAFERFTDTTRASLLGVRLAALPLWSDTGCADLVDAWQRDVHLHDVPLTVRRPGLPIAGIRLSGSTVHLRGGRCGVAVLREVSRFESLGRLADGLAHDFNNVLTIVSGYAAMIGDPHAHPSLVRHHAEEIARAASQATMLTAQLAAFSRPQPPRPRRLDLNDALVPQARLLRRLAGHGVEVVTEFATEPLPVTIDPDHAAHLVMSLASEARECLPHGTTLVVRTSRMTGAELGAPVALAHVAYAVLTVRQPSRVHTAWSAPRASTAASSPTADVAAFGVGVLDAIVSDSAGLLLRPRSVDGVLLHVAWPLVHDDAPALASPPPR